MKKVIIVVGIAAACIFGLFKAVDYMQTKDRAHWQREEERLRNGPCSDTSTLIATTAGSPSSASCVNRLHRMHVQPVTQSGEEVGAVVFCECERTER